MYAVIRWVLFRLEPERAHRLTIQAMRILQVWIEVRFLVMVLVALAAQTIERWRRRP